MFKRIIIVGASSGIGRELAIKYASLGCRVGITARRKEALDKIKESFPENIVTSCFDVSDEKAVERLSSLVTELGGMDLMIYNAGYGDPTPQLDAHTEILTTSTNVGGFVPAAVFAFNYFVVQGHGQIAVTSSVGALRGNGWTPAYSASKAFVSIYAEGLNFKAHRFKKDIVVTDIRAGFVDTKMAKGNGRFWVAPLDKAASQIISAIHRKKRVAYVTKRWWLIAGIMKILPFSLLKRIV